MDKEIKSKVLNSSQKFAVETDSDRVLVVAGAGSGKAIPINTKIPTPKGKVLAKEIKVGDFIFDRVGKPTKVLGVYPQFEKKQVVEILLSNNSKVKCCEEHLWSYYNKNEENLNVVNTRFIINNFKRNKFFLPIGASELNYDEDYFSDSDVNPYVFGVYLGIGAPMSFLSPEDNLDNYFHIYNKPEIAEIIKPLINADKYQLDELGYIYFKDKNDKAIKLIDVFKNKLHFLKKNLCFSGTSENRILVLQGISDAIGNIDSTDFSVSLETYDNEVENIILNLCKSIGIKATAHPIEEVISIDNNDSVKLHSTVIQLYVKKDRIEQIFSIHCKKNIASIAKDKIKEDWEVDKLEIIGIQLLNTKEDMICFEVENEEKLFLMNDFVVTHNTTVITERVRHLLRIGVDPSKIKCITFTNLAAEEMKKRLDSVPGSLFIGTIHSLANNICKSVGIKTGDKINEEDFDWLLTEVMKLGYSLLPEVEHLLLDEAQDICDNEYSFIQKLQPKNLFVVGDDDQAIYGFKGGNTKIIQSMYDDFYFEKHFINENYRNAKCILEYAKNLIQNNTKRIPKNTEILSKDEGSVYKIEPIDAPEIIKRDGKFKEWFFICRTNKQIDKAVELLRREGIPNLTFKKKDLSLSELEELTSSDKVKILTAHAAKGLEIEKVVMVGMKSFSLEERNIAYVSATRAKQELYVCMNEKFFVPKKTNDFF